MTNDPSNGQTNDRRPDSRCQDDVLSLDDPRLTRHLDRLEGRIRHAIACDDPEALASLLDDYIRADDESARRFETWLERHTAALFGFRNAAFDRGGALSA